MQNDGLFDLPAARPTAATNIDSPISPRQVEQLRTAFDGAGIISMNERQKVIADSTGRLVWHALGAKTIDLINENVQVEIPQGAETIVLDAQTIEDLMQGKRKDISQEEIEKQITARIARHLNNPVFVELCKRLNALREK